MENSNLIEQIVSEKIKEKQKDGKEKTVIMDNYNITPNADYNYDFELSNETLINKYMTTLQEINQLDLSLIKDDELKEMLTYVKDNFDEDNATPEGLDILEKYLAGAKKEIEKTSQPLSPDNEREVITQNISDLKELLSIVDDKNEIKVIKQNIKDLNELLSII